MPAGFHSVDPASRGSRSGGGDAARQHQPAAAGIGVASVADAAQDHHCGRIQRLLKQLPVGLAAQRRGIPPRGVGDHAVGGDDGVAFDKEARIKHFGTVSLTCPRRLATFQPLWRATCCAQP